jgi:hypothetical protein
MHLVLSHNRQSASERNDPGNQRKPFISLAFASHPAAIFLARSNVTIGAFSIAFATGLRQITVTVATVAQKWTNDFITSPGLVN